MISSNIHPSGGLRGAPLFYFTGHCLALDEHPQFREKIIELFAGDKSNWEGFVKLCSDHLIIPAIYIKFKQHNLLNCLEFPVRENMSVEMPINRSGFVPYARLTGNGGQGTKDQHIHNFSTELGFITEPKNEIKQTQSIIPEEVVQAFKEIYELNRQRNLQILKQIDDITAVLNKENIQPVFLKGTANLLDGLYGDVGERMIGDIDFLVREDEFLKTANILESDGYQHAVNIYEDLKSRKHYPSLYKEGEIATVEIHRLPVREEHSKKFKPEVVLNDKIEMPGKPGIYVPSDAHKLIHTFIHSQLDDWGHAYKQSSFRGYYDLYLLSKRVDISSLVDQTGYRRKFISWLVFGQRIFGMPDQFYPIETRLAKWYCFKYNMSFSFPGLFADYTIIKKIINLFGKHYAGTFIKALLSPAGRQYMYNKLNNREWIRNYLN